MRWNAASTGVPHKSVRRTLLCFHDCRKPKKSIAKRILNTPLSRKVHWIRAALLGPSHNHPRNIGISVGNDMQIDDNAKEREMERWMYCIQPSCWCSDCTLGYETRSLRKNDDTQGSAQRLTADWTLQTVFGTALMVIVVPHHKMIYKHGVAFMTWGIFATSTGHFIFKAGLITPFPFSPAPPNKRRSIFSGSHPVRLSVDARRVDWAVVAALYFEACPDLSILKCIHLSHITSGCSLSLSSWALHVNCLCCAIVFVWQALVGMKEPLEKLLPEYDGNPKPGFKKGVHDLSKVRTARAVRYWQVIIR